MMASLRPLFALVITFLAVSALAEVEKLSNPEEALLDLEVCDTQLRFASYPQVDYGAVWKDVIHWAEDKHHIQPEERSLLFGEFNRRVESLKQASRTKTFAFLQICSLSVRKNRMIHVTEEQTNSLLLHFVFLLGVGTCTGGVVLFLQRSWSTLRTFDNTV